MSAQSQRRTACLRRCRAVTVTATALCLVALGAPGVAGAGVINCLSATVTASGPVFGTYNPQNLTPTTSNGSVSVTCIISLALTASATATVSLSAGASGSYTPRTMLSAGHPMNYNLFADGAYSQIWGDGTGTSTTVTDNFTFILTGGLFQTVTSTIYGQIQAQQLNVFPGSYTDTITVTVSY
jgi:spore coat protein U-like protein